MHPDTELRFINPDVGYGVFATKAIPRGTVVWVLCRFDRTFTPAEVDALPAAYQPLIERYAYVDQHGDYVLCWDLARNVNHSCDPNMLGVGRDFEVVVRDIQPGEQICCDYGGLNLTGRLRCMCGAANCRGTITHADVLNRWQDLDTQVAENLALAPNVAQPLLGFARDPQQFWRWVHGIDQVPSHREYHAGGVSAEIDCSDRPWARPRRLVGA
jgi:uncharacterized protein